MQSVNQVRQFYVVTSCVANTATPSAKGEVSVKNLQGKDGIIIQHFGEGGLTSTDIIERGQVISAKATPAAQMEKKLKQSVIMLDTNVNGGDPIGGEDYVIDVQVSNYISMADESVLIKFAAAHVKPKMTASDFYIALAKSLARNISRDINHFFKIYLTQETLDYGTDNSTWEEVTVGSKHTASAYTGIILSELAQTDTYVLGESPVRTVNFKVIPHTVIDSGAEVNPFVSMEDESGTIATMDKEASATDSVVSIANGYDMADLEWFCMGERGDQYRQMGYPRTIRTKYMVDPTASYHVLDIAFYFQGRGVDNQKSEKLLTFVSTDAAELNKVITALNNSTTGLGLNITPLTVS